MVWAVSLITLQDIFLQSPISSPFPAQSSPICLGILRVGNPKWDLALKCPVKISLNLTSLHSVLSPYVSQTAIYRFSIFLLILNAYMISDIPNLLLIRIMFIRSKSHVDRSNMAFVFSVSIMIPYRAYNMFNTEGLTKLSIFFAYRNHAWFRPSFH